MTNKKQIWILGGGTVSHIRPHLSLCAPAYGTFARLLKETCSKNVMASNYDIFVGLTDMAKGKEETNNASTIGIGSTNAEVEAFIDTNVIDNPLAKIVFLNVAFCDFDGNVLDSGGNPTPSGKDQPRLKTSDGDVLLSLYPAAKVIGKIRKLRKDIFLVGFKTTANVSEDEQYKLGLDLLKKNSCNLVLANDIQTRKNMIVAPELAKYETTTDRTKVAESLVDISLHRATNSFTRTRITPGYLVKWNHPDVPMSLKMVVDWCVANKAYKPFNNVTVGHFGFKPEAGYMWSSRRKKNFNNVKDRDLVIVDFRDDREQLAYGEKPSAGARSQYMALSKFPNLNCVVHFHCPLKENSVVAKMAAVRPQRNFECGSHQCGENTADGMVKINDNLAVVMLDKHGPNIVFSSSTNPSDVVDFIQDNFDLSKSTE